MVLGKFTRCFPIAARPGGAGPAKRSGLGAEIAEILWFDPENARPAVVAQLTGTISCA